MSPYQDPQTLKPHVQNHSIYKTHYFYSAESQKGKESLFFFNFTFHASVHQFRFTLVLSQSKSGCVSTT